MNAKIFIFALVNLVSFSFGKSLESDVIYRSFPDEFFFGVSTAAYQIEGAWNTSGKGENIWDYLTHNNPHMINNKDTGDVACDSYHLYQRDVEMLKELGVDYYRFSLSWSRLLPSGFSVSLNQDGVDYYNRLIDALIENNIIPFVTLYHWDLPQPLQQMGGWANPLMADYFEQYANIAYKAFGDRVSHWITFNEPKNFCQAGYGGVTSAPALNSSGVGDYMCAHTVLQAHARAYHLYDKKYRATQKGNIGITMDIHWPEPNSSDPADIAAAERDLQFFLGWFAHPIFSEEGDYPQVMKDRISEKSREQGFSRSRLPVFNDFEIKALKGSSDFLGLNYYTGILVSEIKEKSTSAIPSYSDDVGVEFHYDPSWPGSASSWLKVVPWAFRKLLNKIKLEYNNPEVIITENGLSSFGGMNDEDRISYIRQHLNALLDAVDDGCKVSAYTYWSLMDNFEWMRGYSERFGLYEVNFSDPKKKRVPRKSAKYYADIIKNRSVDAYDTRCSNCSDDQSYNAVIV